MHRRMPVVAPVERGCELVRRPHVGVAVQHVGDLVRVLLVHAGERKLRDRDLAWLDEGTVEFDMYVEDEYAAFVRYCFEDPLDAEVAKRLTSAVIV